MMQIYPLRIDIDLETCSRVLRIFWPVEDFFHRSRIYLPVENFLADREYFFLFRDNLIGECRGSPVSEITVSITTAIIIF